MIEIANNDEEIDLPFIIPNPLSGEVGVTKSGKPSYRCDDSIVRFKFAVAEFDNMCRDGQLAFWNSAIERGFPVAALIDSGGKSIHGWLAVHCRNRDQWEGEIENKLFPALLVPMGFDPACRNESRLSRFPGNFRDDKDAMQRLLYLNPEVL